MVRTVPSRRFARERHLTSRHTVGALTACVVIAASIAVLSPLAHAAKPKCFGRVATIVGTNGDDEITGTNGRDVIVSKRGNDTIDARRGRDFVCTGRGGFDVTFAVLAATGLVSLLAGLTTRSSARTAAPSRNWRSARTRGN